MTYENGGQLDRALKRVVRDRGGDPGDGCRRALRDRFLCRVFSNPDGRFILKGGSGLLARIPDGRVTRDIDFPKGTGFSAVSDEEVERVYDAINRRPHKRLGFRTPYEVHYSGVLQLL